MINNAVSQANPLTFVHRNSVIQTYLVPATTKPQPAMAESKLNQVVKGTPPPNLNPPPPAPLAMTTSPADGDTDSTRYAPQDPHLSTLPSAPAQIYLNLLILEASLRSQYLHLLSRRRLNTFFLLLLFLWNALFIYALFLKPREDGLGVGGSIYWFVETFEKIALLGGVVTVLLVWGTGQWERGVRWPRRWLGTTNRGLRGFNLRVVATKGTWYREMLGHFAFLLPFGLWREAGGSDWNLIEHHDRPGELVEEDLASGGDHIMLLLLPKSFSPEFRENWEEYRQDYWAKENERRIVLRRRVRSLKRQRAKEYGGWRWWTGCWRVVPHHSTLPHAHLPPTKGRHHDLEKQPHSTKIDSAIKASRRRSMMRSESAHSQQSSRSATPNSVLEFDGTLEKLNPERTRRGSSSSVRRKRRDGAGTAGSTRNSMSLSPLTIDEDGAASSEGRRTRGSRPSTPGSEKS